MNFSFGILTDNSSPERIAEIIQSIRNLNIPKYEIMIICGDKIPEDHDVRHIPFDETIKWAWVTKKKNVLAAEAIYDNVVIFHDYYVFDKDWYKHYLEFGEDWDVCSNAQLLINGKRHFTDWVCWDSPIFPRYTSLAYHDWSHTQYMYQSGGYMLVKKQLMAKCPWNEELGWGTAEDVEWSLRMRNIANWKCNGSSIVKHNKVHRDAQ